MARRSACGASSAVENEHGDREIAPVTTDGRTVDWWSDSEFWSAGMGSGLLGFEHAPPDGVDEFSSSFLDPDLSERWIREAREHKRRRDESERAEAERCTKLADQLAPQLRDRRGDTIHDFELAQLVSVRNPSAPRVCRVASLLVERGVLRRDETSPGRCWLLVRELEGA